MEIWVRLVSVKRLPLSRKHLRFVRQFSPNFISPLNAQNSWKSPILAWRQKERHLSCTVSLEDFYMRTLPTQSSKFTTTSELLRVKSVNFQPNLSLQETTNSEEEPPFRLLGERNLLKLQRIWSTRQQIMSKKVDMKRGKQTRCKGSFFTQQKWVKMANLRKCRENKTKACLKLPILEILWIFIGGKIKIWTSYTLQQKCIKQLQAAQTRSKILIAQIRTSPEPKRLLPQNSPTNYEVREHRPRMVPQVAVMVIIIIVEIQPHKCEFKLLCQQKQAITWVDKTSKIAKINKPQSWELLPNTKTPSSRQTRRIKLARWPLQLEPVQQLLVLGLRGILPWIRQSVRHRRTLLPEFRPLLQRAIKPKVKEIWSEDPWPPSWKQQPLRIEGALAVWPSRWRTRFRRQSKECENRKTPPKWC